MKLSELFNQPERKTQLDHLEEALGALKAQRRHLNEGNDKILQSSFALTQTEMILRRAEAYNRGPLPRDSAGADSLALQTKKLHDLKVDMARNVIADEKKFTAAVAAAFADPKQAQQQFTATATDKVVNPRLIDRQIGQINALIDNGSFGNTMKRVAWQAVNTFTRN